MEILGIVWAASIVHPAAAKSTKQLEPSFMQPHDPSLIYDEPWWRSLQATYRWTALWQSSTLPVVSGSLSSPETDGSPAQNESASTANSRVSFQALVPVVSPILSSFEPFAELAVDELATSASLLAKKFELDTANHDGHDQLASSAAVPAEPTTAQITLTPVVNSACQPALPAHHQQLDSASNPNAKNQVWIHNRFIGEVSGEATAQKIAAQLAALTQSNEFDLNHLLPLVGDDFVGIGYQDRVLFIVDEKFKSHPEVPATVTAVQWVNNLRAAFDAAPMGVADVQMAIAGLTTTSETLHGMASWYGPWFHGKQTANGEIFDENALTAAHKTLPFNTRLKVTNRLNGRAVVVRINDRGPYVGERSLDLSKAAAQCLGSTTDGVVPYDAVILEPIDKPELEDLTTALLPSD